jgi:hypothetical protein
MEEHKYINSAAGGSNIGRLPPNGLYLNANQLRDHEPTTYENILADMIERAYAQGIHELVALVTFLNEAGSQDPDGQAWTEESFQKTLSEFAA